jgi:Glutathione peroxidase
MSQPHKIVLVGFSSFEKVTFESFFRLAARRPPGYVLVEDASQAHLAVVNADDSAVLRQCIATKPAAQVLLIGSQDGGTGWMLQRRPLNLMKVLATVESLLATPTASMATVPAELTPMRASSAAPAASSAAYAAPAARPAAAPSPAASAFSGFARTPAPVSTPTAAPASAPASAPCNQFGGQESGSEEEIASFCELNFGVSFPLMGKVEVNGAQATPLYQWLCEQAPGLLGSKAIKWNFTKFLVGKDGQVIKRYAPQDTPQSLAKDIEAALA